MREIMLEKKSTSSPSSGTDLSTFLASGLLYAIAGCSSTGRAVSAEPNAQPDGAIKGIVESEIGSDFGWSPDDRIVCDNVQLGTTRSLPQTESIFVA